MAVKEMYLLPEEHSNAARIYGESIRKVEVTVGRKYFSDASGHRFPVEKPEQDENGNIYYHEYDPQYSGDYLLFETEDAAMLHLKRRQFLAKLLRQRNRIHELPYAQLAAIDRLIQSNTDDKVIIYATDEEDALHQILGHYKENDICIGDLLESIAIEGLPVASQVRVYASLMKRVEEDSLIQINKEEGTQRTLDIGE